MEQLQTSNYTEPDRYPAQFALVAQLTAPIARIRPRRILSFGCSTGEEPYILAVKYAPEAQVFATDLDSSVLEKARECHALLDRIVYMGADHAKLALAGPFDVVWAMSVFCLWPVTKDMSDIAAVFPFDRFAQSASFLASLVAPGGFLAIYNANYSFLDLRAAAGFDLVRDPQADEGGFVHRFDRFGRASGQRAVDWLYRRHAVI